MVNSPAHEHHEQTTTATEFKDPVCGMTVVPRADTASYVHQGLTYFFCHPGCMRRFAADPDEYLAPKTSSPQNKLPHQSGPSSNLHATNKPAPGIDARADAHKRTTAASEYFCPMHPEVVQNKAGDCPKCGMALEPRDTSATEGNEELTAMSLRLRAGGTIAAIVVTVGMLEHIFEHQVYAVIPPQALHWAMLVLTAPVIFWAGWTFFVRAWRSIISLSPNMFTLIALGVTVAFGYSVFATIFPGSVPASSLMHPGVPYVYFEASAAIIALALLGQVLELKARAQTTDSLKSLLSLAPKTARKISDDGSEAEVAVESLKAGDLLRIRPGESIPADGVLVDGTSNVDESIMTGEPLPVVKEPHDKLMAGTVNGTGSFTMRAEQIGRESLLAQVVELARTAQMSRVPMQALVDKVSYIFVPAVILAALATFFVWNFLAGNWAQGMLCAIAVLIIACPCALGLAMPMSITVAVGLGARNGVLVRNTKALQRLKDVDTVVVDKTGTLTEGKPTVTAVGTGRSTTQQALIAYAAAVEKASEHPLSKAVLDAAAKRNIKVPLCVNFEYIPGKGVAGDVDGHRVAIGSENFMRDLSITVASNYQNISTLRAEGQVVLLVAIDRALAGWIAVSDPIKPSARQTIDALKAEKINVVMLTGDNEQTAAAVCKQLGIEQFHAGFLPAEKLTVIKKMQEEGHIVAMSGDGVNDAAALAQADVGIAMGTGADIAMQQADIVLLAGNLQGIMRAVRLSRATMRNVKQNLSLAFGYNMLAVPLAAGVLYPLLGWLLNPMVASAAMSLSSVSVIANALRLRKVNLN